MDRMNEAKRMHERAMQLLNEALFVRQQGEAEMSASLRMDAFRLERAAAESLLERFDLEPTRSILFKGAAVLALQVNLGREAERLARLGLAGDPPEYVAAELWTTLERAGLYLHGGAGRP